MGRKYYDWLRNCHDRGIREDAEAFFKETNGKVACCKRVRYQDKDDCISATYLEFCKDLGRILDKAEAKADTDKDNFIMSRLQLKANDWCARYWKERKRRKTENMGEKINDVAQDEHPPEKLIEYEEEREKQEQEERMLWECIQALKEPHRSIVIMRVCDGLSFKEIAEHLKPKYPDMTEGNARQKYFIAKKKLERCLGVKP